MKKVDWTKWSAIAEIISSIAIVLTLAYLAIQTNQLATQTEQNTEALHANSREATMQADVDYVLAYANFPELSSESGMELSPLDEVRLDNLNTAFFRIREYAWFQYQEGILGEAPWASYTATTLRRLRLPQTIDWWERYSSELDPEFVEYINRRLATGTE